MLHSLLTLPYSSMCYCAPILHSTLHSNMHSLSHLFRIHLFVLCYALHLCTQFCTLLKHSVFNFHSKCVQQKTAKIVSFLHTVRNLHFLSKNSILFSRDNCRFFWVKNSWKCCGFGLPNCLQLRFHEKNCQKILGEKLVKMLRFWTF